MWLINALCWEWQMPAVSRCVLVVIDIGCTMDCSATGPVDWHHHPWRPCIFTLHRLECTKPSCPIKLYGTAIIHILWANAYYQYSATQDDVAKDGHHHLVRAQRQCLSTQQNLLSNNMYLVVFHGIQRPSVDRDPLLTNGFWHTH